MNKQLIIKTSLLLILASATPAIADSSLLPMYGGEDRSNDPELSEKDNTFIAKATRSFSSREHAAEGYVERGFDMYSQNKFDKAMQAFNQAWLLDPNNPYPYLGFGLMLKNEKKFCKTIAMFLQAHQKGLYENGFLADYAHATTRCALTRENQLQKKLFDDANILYNRAIQTPNNALRAYVYHSWAKSYFLQNDFSNSLAMIEQSKILGGKIDAALDQSLKEKIMEAN